MKRSDNKEYDGKDDPFDKIMEQIGSKGKFQWIYASFMIATTIAACFIQMNIILALNIPDHWCLVPGRNTSNLTKIEWKQLTLPKKINNRGENDFSSCQMFQISEQNSNNSGLAQKDELSHDCQYGYEFDQEYYDESIPAKENWFCDRELYVTKVLIISKFVNILGSSILGYLGDSFGRQRVVILSILVAFFGRILTIFTTSSYYSFLAASGLAIFTTMGFLQMPYIISMEITGKGSRGDIALLSMIGWSIGSCILALVYWWVRHWLPFMWITTIPVVIIFFFYKYMIESPRWLIGKKKFNVAIVELRKIAKVNGKELKIDEYELCDLFKSIEPEKNYGIASIFSHWRLAKNALIIEFIWCIVILSGFTLTLFSTEMGGNPFLNFFLQSIVEIPAMYIGKYSSNLYGRRLTCSGFLLLSGLACIPIILMARNSSYESIIIGLTIFIKLTNCSTNLAISLREVEMYPTCLRSSGMSLSGVLANIVSSLSPYFVYLGANINICIPYYIIFVLYLFGSIVSLFAPETLNQKLPDTIEEAKYFGKNQAFWTIPNRQKKNGKPASEFEMLNANDTKRVQE